MKILARMEAFQESTVRPLSDDRFISLGGGEAQSRMLALGFAQDIHQRLG